MLGFECQAGFRVMAATICELHPCCSYGASTLTPGCSLISGRQRLRSASPAGGLLKITLRKQRDKKHLRNRAVTRSLYSPLVESFESSKRRSNSEAESSSLSKDKRTEAKVDEENDEIESAPEDPLTAAASGDGAHAEKLADIDVKKGARGRPRARARPPSMSLSQGFSSVGRRAISHSVGAVGRPLNSTKVPGPIGFVMALAVAVIGVKTAVEKQGLLPGTPQKICEKCEGYGVQQCHVCQGRGVLVWEGKLRHTDPCPLCFGRCVKKCPDCGGMKIRKGLPSALTQNKK